MKHTDWIDFEVVKRSVSMEMLILYYGFEPLRRKEAEVRLKCPFHEGKSSTSMLINLETNCFFCFNCQAKGSVLDFVANYEDCSIKEAALKLNDWFITEKKVSS